LLATDNDVAALDAEILRGDFVFATNTQANYLAAS
jgi:hypothetical protein